MSEVISEESYFEKRLKELGCIDPELYTVHNYQYGGALKGGEGFQDVSFQIFQKDADDNIRIFYPTLDGLKAQYKRKDSKWSKDFTITRLKNPKGEMKYAIPKGAGTLPFLPPSIIRKYQEKQKIDVLFLTEGAFKAFKGAMHGLDIIALTSITHAKDRYTMGLHEDIRIIIQTCQVKKVVWLVDGDCNRLSSKPIADIEDLRRRPNQFFQSVCDLKQYLDEFKDLEKWFIHPVSDDLEGLGKPKGIDDLLCAVPGMEHDVINDLLSFHKKGNYRYFHKIQFTWSTAEVHRYFRLGNVDEFFLFHCNTREDLRKEKKFVFNGTQYEWDEEKNTCKVITPADAKNFFRVGDQYYEKFQIPNKYGELENVFHRRMKSTISDDHGKDFCRHIAKYKAFCNKPDHINYQDIIHACFNMYAPFEHEPDDGECENTIEFLKHIFGTKDIHFTHPKTNEKLVINELDLGLDYIQLLYQQPTQILPIICLVSKENGTGKSTFAKWLKLIFTQNVAIVGNADLANDFNASWASKLLVICDEAKIDKQVVIEKVKALSTADKLFMNAKGKDQIEIDFFAKFCLLTNNEENFIYASEEDVRYWIRKVPVASDLKVDLLKLMHDEIQPFLKFLNERKLSTDCLHRAWFDPKLIKTEALMKVVQNSKPTIEKEIRSKIREMFFLFDVDEIMMTPTKVSEEFFRSNRFEHNFVYKVLKDNMKLEQYKNDEGNVVTLRYKYPRYERIQENGRIDLKKVEVNDIGRPFIFTVDKFLLPDEIAHRGPQGESIVEELKADPDLPF